LNPPVAGTGEQGSGLRVLLVDDDAINIKVLSRRLLRSGLQVETGEDGEDVVRRCLNLRQRFDLLLLDEHMRRMSGSTATRALRMHEREQGLPPMPVIMTTANASEGDMKRYYACGANGVLEKPMDLKKLVEALETFLAIHNESAFERTHDPPNLTPWGEALPGRYDHPLFDGSLVLGGLHIFGRLKGAHPVGQ